MQKAGPCLGTGLYCFMGLLGLAATVLPAVVSVGALVAELVELAALVIGLAAVVTVAIDGPVEFPLIVANFAIAGVIPVSGLRSSSASEHHQGAQDCREKLQFPAHNGLLGNEDCP